MATSMCQRAAIRTMAAAVLAVPTLVLRGWAEATYLPGKIVRIVVPFAASGTTDILSRVVAEILTDAMGAKFIVDKLTGAWRHRLRGDRGQGSCRRRDAAMPMPNPRPLGDSCAATYQRRASYRLSGPIRLPACPAASNLPIEISQSPEGSQTPSKSLPLKCHSRGVVAA